MIITRSNLPKNIPCYFLFYFVLIILALSLIGCDQSYNEVMADDTIDDVGIVLDLTNEALEQDDGDFILSELPVDFSALNAIIDEIIMQNLNAVGQFILYYLLIVWTFFLSLPVYIRAVSYISMIAAFIGTIASHALGIYRNKNEWQKHPGHDLMYSYFINSGTFQRKKSYNDAHKLLRDRKWLLVSFAGLAFRLGNYSNKSKILMFILAFAYIPLAIIGFCEMVFRILFGTIWLLVFNLIHSLMLFGTKLISFLMIPISKIFDNAMRNVQYCPHCYNTFNMPEFICPECGRVHKELIPGRCGVLFVRCGCNKKILPCATFTGRSRLVAKCPACTVELAAANARHLSIALIGGESTGKTAFLSAFSKSYIDNAKKKKALTVNGKPANYFDELSRIFSSGKTSKESESRTYSLVHKYGKREKDNLVIYDTLADYILADSYPRSPKYLGYCDGIIVLIDPLSVRSVRDTLATVGDTKTTTDYSADEVDKLVVQFKNQYAKICGIKSGKMSRIPVAIVVNKVDIEIVKSEIGRDTISELYNQNMAAYCNDFDGAKNQICRAYLEKLGLINVLNNIDATFLNVDYFPVSAIGHVSEEGVKFTPIGVLNPVAWIARKNHSSISVIFSPDGLCLKLVKLHEKFVKTLRSIKR